MRHSGRRALRHSRTSMRVLNLWSSMVSHCMLLRWSAPPAQRGVAWSTWCPGQAPRLCPVDGQGVDRLKASTSAALRWMRASTCSGSATAITRAKSRRTDTTSRLLPKFSSANPHFYSHTFGGWSCCSILLARIKAPSVNGPKFSLGRLLWLRLGLARLIARADSLCIKQIKPGERLFFCGHLCKHQTRHQCDCFFHGHP